MEVWVSPAALERSAAGAHLGLGSCRGKGIAVNSGEVPVICALPFVLPSSEQGCLSRCGRRLLVMDIIPGPCRNFWVRCWSAKILAWAVSDPFKSDLDVCAVQDVVLGTRSS